MKHDTCVVSLLHYVCYLPNNRATTPWRKLNTNLVYSWAPKPGYRLLLVPVCRKRLIMLTYLLEICVVVYTLPREGEAAIIEYRKRMPFWVHRRRYDIIRAGTLNCIFKLVMPSRPPYGKGMCACIRLTHLPLTAGMGRRKYIYEILLTQSPLENDESPNYNIMALYAR